MKDTGDIMSKRPIGNRRLHPSKFDTDYYMLSRLRTFLERVIDLYVKEENLIFDYGCGDAPYRELFSKAKYISGDIAGNAKADITFDPGVKVPNEDGTFDVVLSSQVLEHVPDVKFYLQEANRMLINGGLLIISTHGWWTHHPYPQDLWRWTREGLEKILNDNGFKIIDSNWMIGMLAYSCQLRVQCWKGILKNRNFPSTIVLNLISYCYQQIMRHADRITPDYIGQNNAAIYFLVAKKSTTSR